MWTKISTKILLNHPRLVVEEDEVCISSNNVIQYLRFSNGSDGVVIIARNKDDKILFLREYSYVLDTKILQLPMGKIEPDESPIEAANRELQEEASYKASSLTVIGSYFQNHRRSNNKGIVVTAEILSQSSKEGDIEEGEIEKLWIPTHQINNLIKQGDIVDADTLSSLLLYKLPYTNPQT